jgi:tetrapyrrole methylase family protein / MazG family protein
VAARLPRVTVIGLGPAGPDLWTAATLDAIGRVPIRFLRTERHPSATAVPGASSFDHHYEHAGVIEDVYPAIVEDLVAAAGRHDHVLYAVPGSPAVAERSVELLRADPRVAVDVIPALSVVDLAWVTLGVDPLAAGARIVDAHRFEAEAAGERGPLLVLQCDRADLLSTIKLSVEEAPTEPVTVLQRLGLADELVTVVPWDALDRVEPDHLTSVWIPSLAAPVGRDLVGFADLVRTLRQQCPWDRQQTHRSLRPYLLEEAYEVLEAIDGLPDADAGDGGGERWAHLEEELGDLLFQVFFHATLAAEEGRFTLADVAGGIHAKLVRRHPHVFGNVAAATAGEVVTNWDRIKREEKGRESVMDGIPSALPALLLAQKVQRRAASVGFDWDSVDGAWPKVVEEMAEVQAASGDEVEAEFGDLLFACVNVGRHLGLDPEDALRRATAKFRGRFAGVEALARSRGVDLAAADLATLDAMWDEVKLGGGS